MLNVSVNAQVLEGRVNFSNQAPFQVALTENQNSVHVNINGFLVKIDFSNQANSADKEGKSLFSEVMSYTKNVQDGNIIFRCRLRRNTDASTGQSNQSGKGQKGQRLHRPLNAFVRPSPAASGEDPVWVVRLRDGGVATRSEGPTDFSALSSQTSVFSDASNGRPSGQARSGTSSGHSSGYATSEAGSLKRITPERQESNEPRSLASIIAGLKQVGLQQSDANCGLSDRGSAEKNESMQTLNRLCHMAATLNLFGDTQGEYASKSNVMKSDLREMIEQLSSDLEKEPLSPPEKNTDCISGLTALRQHIDREVTSPVIKSNRQKRIDADSLFKKTQSDRSLSALRRLSSESEQQLLSSDMKQYQKTRLRNIKPVAQPKLEEVELESHVLIGIMEKLDRDTSIIESEEKPINRNVLRDFDASLTDFISRWSKPKKRDLNVAIFLGTERLSGTVEKFTKVQKRIRSLFSGGSPDRSSSKRREEDTQMNERNESAANRKTVANSKTGARETLTLKSFSRPYTEVRAA